MRNVPRPMARSTQIGGADTGCARPSAGHRRGRGRHWLVSAKDQPPAEPGAGGMAPLSTIPRRTVLRPACTASSSTLSTVFYRGRVRAGGSGRAPVEDRAYLPVQCTETHNRHTVYSVPHIVRPSKPSRLLGAHARRFGRPRLRHRARLLVRCHPQRWMGGASETSRRRSPHSCTRGDPRLLCRDWARAHTRGVRRMRAPTAHLPMSAPRRLWPQCVSAAAARCLGHGRVQLCRSRDTCTCASTTRSKSSPDRDRSVARPQRVSWPRQRGGHGRGIAWSWPAPAAPSPRHLGVAAHCSGLAASAWPPMARRRRPTPPRQPCALAPVVGSRTTTASAG